MKLDSLSIQHNESSKLSSGVDDLVSNWFLATLKISRMSSLLVSGPYLQKESSWLTQDTSATIVSLGLSHQNSSCFSWKNLQPGKSIDTFLFPSGKFCSTLSYQENKPSEVASKSVTSFISPIPVIEVYDVSSNSFLTLEFLQATKSNDKYRHS